MLSTVTLRHAWPEGAGFVLTRPTGIYTYTFLHFWNPVTLRIGDRLIETKPSACLIYRPNTPQWFRSDTPLVHDWIHMTGEVDEVLEQYGLCGDTVYYPRQVSFITETVQTLEEERLSGHPFSVEYTDLKLRELFVGLARELSAEPEGASASEAMIGRLNLLRRQVQQTLDYPWTVPEMAARMHLGQSQFYALYKTVFGVSPLTDLIHTRIDAARNLLMVGDRTVAQVAEEVGYANVTHFIRQFRSLTGTTPHRFAAKKG